MPTKDLDFLQFSVNGHLNTVSQDIPPWLPLIDYLRNEANLTGSKVLCRVGGCGACTVVVTRKNAIGSQPATCAVNACQVLLYMCHGWEIETIESLGNRHDGYHPIQKSLAGFFGSQCGYCSPGMVMAMYGKVSSSSDITQKEVESLLDGNLCRCTGYRPILDAFTALASDAPQNLRHKLADIEDLYEKMCDKKGVKCKGSCVKEGPCNKKTLMLNEEGNAPDYATSSLDVTVSGVRWMRPTSLQELSRIINELNSSDYRIIAGNTGQGVYKPHGPSSNYIDISMVQELAEMPKMIDKDFHAESIKLGAMVTLGSAIKIFENVSAVPGFGHLKLLAAHWVKVANTSVRNLGTWAGNLMLKNLHNEFPSDVFVTLAAAEAQLDVLCCNTATPHTKTLAVQDLLNLNMSQALIVSVTLPKLQSNVQIRTYKVSCRAANSHAYVNAAFCFHLDSIDGITVLKPPKLFYGGISPHLCEASKTETFFSGKKLTEEGLMIEAAKILASEMIPVTTTLEASPEYRLSLAQNLLYKAVVSILGEKAATDVRSAGENIIRPLKTSQQSFKQSDHYYPVGQPLRKVESLQQVSGEAEFVNDITTLPGELIAVFVHSKIARGKLGTINTDKAKEACGVKAILLAQDIPGVNSIIAMAGPESEPLLASDEISYAGQAVALVVAQTKEQADAAAKMVVVEYEDVKKPILTIAEALAEGRWKLDGDGEWKLDGDEPFSMGDVNEGFKHCEHILEGELSMGGQYHFAMEPISARVHPIEDGYEVSATTQWTAEVQAAVAQVLDTEVSSVNLAVRRIGGGFGGKISRPSLVASAAALGAWKTRRPVRMALTLNESMALMGGREPFLAKYKVGFNSDGRLVALDLDLITDGGFTRNEVAANIAMATIPNLYSCPYMKVTPGTVTTNTAANTFMRCPGIVNSIATMENIIEHIAHFLGKDAEKVREMNYATSGTQRIFTPPLMKNTFSEKILPLLKNTSNLVERKTKVENFNAENRWRKRGLTIMPFWFNLYYVDFFRYGILVNIYQHDGSVAVAHGGVEMGQGLNTKVIQIVSHLLGVEMDKIKIKPTNSLTNANSFNFGASMCADIVCNGVKIACERIKSRLDEVSNKWVSEKGGAPSWLELIQYSIEQDVDICERYWSSSKEFPTRYDIWGGACVEVEVDILTGQFHIIRCDLIEDCGQSMNPMVDIGQVEGAFIMGLGLLTSEKLVYDPESGIKLSAGTWDYHPPVAQDIPTDFRVTLLPNSFNNGGVLRSKAVGEPPLCLSYCVITALRAAITAARKQYGIDSWFDMPTPVSPEDIQQLCKVEAKHLIL